MGRVILLDLFCCAGGAARGYQRAGFHVIGVDIVDHSEDYAGDEFIQGDALEIGHELLSRGGIDAVHASPPCQAFSAPTLGTHGGNNGKWPELISPTRKMLQEFHVPWMIENVQGAPLRKDLMLCGEMFGLDVIRHRIFELGNVSEIPQPLHPRHRGRVRGRRHGVYYDGPYIAAYGKGRGKGDIIEINAAMGTDWIVDRRYAVEAIPPAYTEYIGNHLSKGRSWHA